MHPFLNKVASSFDVSGQQVLSLFKNRKDYEGTNKTILFFVGFLLTPITLIGALWGYVRSYDRFLRGRNDPPDLAPLVPIQRVAMILGAVVIWLVGYIIWKIVVFLFQTFFSEEFLQSPGPLIIIGANLILTPLFLLFFNLWRNRIYNTITEATRFGTARFARNEELADLTLNQGLYIGNLNYAYPKQGHLITVAGTRGGKGVNLIIPNLLGKSNYEGSWVVIDPKGENAAITARYQRSKGQDVQILDPWRLQAAAGSEATYNPLDLIASADNEHLSDDATIIAEMIVPSSDKGEQFFNDRARSMISGMLIHIVLTAENPHLGILWECLRRGDEQWNELVADMAVSDNPIVKATGNEILNIMTKSDKTFGSILSTAQQYTDFLKSPALQRSLTKSNFEISKLSEGKTTLYIIIPADKLHSHYQWLRLVVTTALRAVIRNKNKRVTFLLDEFAALGYISEIRTALSTYAGFNVTVWPILQSLIQLQDKYGKDWETFLGNTAVKQFFNVGDNFTADYLSSALGETTFITYPNDGQGHPRANATARRLVTPGEVRRGSGDNIFALIEQRPPTYFRKYPYYEIGELQERYDVNPYFNDI